MPERQIVRTREQTRYQLLTQILAEGVVDRFPGNRQNLQSRSPVTRQLPGRARAPRDPVDLATACSAGDEAAHGGGIEVKQYLLGLERGVLFS